MISPEPFIFSQIASLLRAEYPGVFVSGEYVDAPAKFPAVTIIEADNSVYQRMRTTDVGNAALLMYEVNVYSNQTGYKKSQAKAIMDTIDKQFASLGFTRTMCNPVSNLHDATIYRITARYEGVVMLEQMESGKTLRIYMN